MSYAEHGTRIFFAGINTKPSVDQGDGFGHRLKMIESCSDIRAWSSDPLENFRYFREMTEQTNATAIIMPNIALEEAIENHKEDEIENLKRELAKYKTLNLTNEQRKKLEQRDYDDVLVKEDLNVFDCIFQQLYKLTGYKEVTLRKSVPTFTEIKRANNNKLKSYDTNGIPNSRNGMENKKNKKLIQTKSSTDISFSFSRESFHNENMESRLTDENVKIEANNTKFDLEKKTSASSLSNYINYEDNDNGNDDNNSNDESQLSDTLSESERSYKIITESMIIALKNTLNAKDVEICELKEANSRLRLCLDDRDSQIKHLRDDFQDTRNHFQGLSARNNEELNEWKNEVLNGRKIIDQLRRSLEEKREECDNQSQQLNNLKRDSIDVVSIKSERDSLASTSEEISKLLKNAGYHDDNLGQGIKRILYERNKLLALKNGLELSCSDKEDEITKLFTLINQLEQDNKSQTMMIKEMEEDIEKKTQTINHYEEQIASLTKQCIEKSEIEKSFHENELIDGDCDQAFSKYFKQSLDKLHELTNALKDAGDDVEKRKKEIKKLKKQMDENIRAFKDQLNKKSKEGRFYRFQYEECQKIIDRQIGEIDNLKRVIDKLEKKLIYKMELSVSELHQEHDNLTTEIQNLTSLIYERNIKIVELESERENLLNKIDYTSAQLDEKNVKIEALKEQNSKVLEKIDDSKKNIEDISNALQSIQFQIEKVYQVSLLDKKVALEEKGKKKLGISIMDSHENHTHQNLNENLKDDVINMLNQTESLEYKISSIKDGINIISSGLNVNIDSKESLKNLPSEIKEESNNSHNLSEKKTNIDKKISSQRIESDEEIKNTNHAMKLSKQKNKDLNLKFNGKRMIHQNSLRKKSQYFSEIIKSYCGNNKISKGLETQSLDDESGFLSETSAFSTKTKNFGQSTSENDEHIIFMQYNRNKKTNERSIDEESEKSESPSCKQFILHCGERLSNEKYG